MKSTKIEINPAAVPTATPVKTGPAVCPVKIATANPNKNPIEMNPN
jgi:small neutral amino acid transporter SnatA (MarC family)